MEMRRCLVSCDDEICYILMKNAFDFELQSILLLLLNAIARETEFDSGAFPTVALRESRLWIRNIIVKELLFASVLVAERVLSGSLRIRSAANKMQKVFCLPHRLGSCFCCLVNHENSRNIITEQCIILLL